MLRAALSVSMAISLGACGSGPAAQPPDATPQARVVINEVMAKNTFTVRSPQGNFVPWIELRNTSNTELDLTGLSLSFDALPGRHWSLPSRILGAKQYTVIFADETTPNVGPAPWPFDEAPKGVWLKSDNKDIAFLPLGTPKPYADVSIGFARESFVAPILYHATPTPGAANSDGSATFEVAAPRFSHSRGYYKEPIRLELFAQAEAKIYYTLDGTAPGPSTGTQYTAPILLTNYMMVRALAIRLDGTPTEVAVHSFLFMDQVLAAPTIQPRIKNDPVLGPQLEPSLRSLPGVFLTTASTINLNTQVPVSVEFYDPAGAEPGFHIDAGIKHVGNHSVLAFPKKSMRLFFKSEFGPTKLRYPLFAACCTQPGTVPTDKFDELTLRANHDSLFYLGTGAQPPANGQYIRNRFTQETQMRMGHRGTNGRFVQVFLNGEYIGQFDLQERPTAEFMESYEGGEKEQYAEVNGAVIGDLAVWSQVRASAVSWPLAQRWIDIDNLIDYMLLNFVAGNDWDWLTRQNWFAAGPRQPSEDPQAAKWRFFAWDNDITYINPLVNITKPNTVARTGLLIDPPDGLFTALRAHPQFLARFAQRVDLHFGPGGELTDEKMKAAYMAVGERVRLSLIAESARWGDYAGRDWTVDKDWVPEHNRIMEQFFNGRAELVRQQLRAEGLIQ